MEPMGKLYTQGYLRRVGPVPGGLVGALAL